METLETVLTSLNPAGWVKFLGLGPYFAATRNEDIVAVQVTKEVGARLVAHVRVMKPLVKEAVIHRFTRNPTAPHGWEEQT